MKRDEKAKAAKQQKSISRNILHKIGLIPTYTEVSLFLMSLTFIFLIITNSKLQNIIYRYWLEDPLDIILLGIIMIFGMIFSIYYTFSKNEILGYAKSPMIVFAVFVNSFAGIAAGYYIITQTKNFLFIFPLLNIIYAVMLLIFFRINIINESSISDKQAEFHEILVGLIAIVFIFIISQYVFKNYWAITFSICVVYASMINEIITNIFYPKLTKV